MRKLNKGEYVLANTKEKFDAYFGEGKWDTFVLSRPDYGTATVYVWHHPSGSVFEFDFSKKPFEADGRYVEVFEEEEITKTVSLAEVYVLKEDVDAYLKKWCVIVCGKNSTTINDDEAFVGETPYETTVRLETLLKHAPHLFDKLA